MQEQAKVVKTQNSTATVRIDKKSQCESCGMCLFPKNASSIEVKANNKLNAEVGDTVLISREKDGKFMGAILVFLVPLLLIGLSAVISLVFIGKELWLLILSLIFIFLWYTILAVIDKKLQKTRGFAWEIVEITQKGENENADTGDNR